MGSVRPADFDREFAEMMIRRNQGAIDLTEAQLGHGDNGQLQRIAQD